jgi:hypothetical protein
VELIVGSNEQADHCQKKDNAAIVCRKKKENGRGCPRERKNQSVPDS